MKGSIPDFVLIREDYKEWWIVEVERIEDRITHVKQQIDNFTNGTYNSVIEAEYLYKNNTALDLNKLKKLTLNSPKVLLIVDDINSTWIDALEEFEPSICIIKQYKSSAGTQLYSVSGDYPYIYEEKSHCSFTNAMLNLMKLSNPDVLFPIIDKKKRSIVNAFISFFISKPEHKTEDVYLISFKGQVTEWKLIRDGENVFLQAIGPHALQVNDSYIIRRTTTKIYTIEPC